MCSLARPQITRLTQGMKYDQIKLKKLGQSYKVRKSGGVRTSNALHCGGSIFNMAMKAVEIGRF